MDILHDYRADKQLRDSFNRLAEQTFGLNFEGWYQKGFWGENYDPHSIVIDGEVVSNVSVNRRDLVFGGRRYHILQLGTVMTAPEYRGRGLNRAIMEYIEREYADADGIYLFANDTVVDYYPRFGFRPGREMACRKAVIASDTCRAEQVLMDGPAAWDRLAKAMEKSTFREGCPMVGNPGLIFFYVSQFMTDAVYIFPLSMPGSSQSRREAASPSTTSSPMHPSPPRTWRRPLQVWRRSAWASLRKMPRAGKAPSFRRRTPISSSRVRLLRNSRSEN